MTFGMAISMTSDRHGGRLLHRPQATACH